MNKPQKRPVNGVLLLDKPTGLSSNTALQKARRLYRAEKAGHTGVLDPLATGLLPVCFGEATKFAQYLLDADKAYTATLKLGEATSTGDAEGEIVATARADISLAEFQTACQALTGAIRQVPPMFSALKHEGKPLYEYARKGIVIERKPRDIIIYSIDIKSFTAPQAVIDVRCSKGTYIRTLSEDIAKHIGTFAHLTALRRTETAGFTISETHTLEQLATLSEPERDALLLPCDVLVSHLPRITLPESSVKMLKFGRQPDYQAELPESTPVRIYAEDGNFIGLAEYLPQQGRLKALRLMNTTENR
ncbi:MULTISPECIES: tRNA pseudouridine(55) synthase TruB [unclassified Neisseria]|uniref:tRNA pseudouridine(55) synthase TruB n=1 Tax=unclassified Neisseria TaxID=2623750 RepID=UPI00266671A0|nr:MULTISPECIES: tRNA pseudouridine(55) synthase TruB [unclassified Neisseria]MDO1509295.1 tRNA pseudouridine(55) synthase TruB [Neisseria sp. MVDL19-042950]MDO1515426.1 tRNA pseudouridine(55) synthase TruB [Neisseria sp. MVDL18-041461]MDO1562786.1 tRNA pseudouridine(55) synthase TruB [Neisseria sp. MVDL20-010259]